MTKPAFDLSLSVLLPLVRDSIMRPRETGRYLIGLGLPANLLWLMLLTVATVSALLGEVSALILLPSAQAIDGVFLANPLLMAVIQWGVLVLTVYAVYGVGNLMGGQGQIADVLALMCWLQFVMLCVQVVQTVALFLLPGLAEFVTILGFFLFLWLFTAFVATVHGFTNMAIVFVMILVSTLVLSFALTLLLTAFGITLEGIGGV